VNIAGRNSPDPPHMPNGDSISVQENVGLNFVGFLFFVNGVEKKCIPKREGSILEGLIIVLRNVEMMLNAKSGFLSSVLTVVKNIWHFPARLPKEENTAL